MWNYTLRELVEANRSMADMIMWFLHLNDCWWFNVITWSIFLPSPAAAAPEPACQGTLYLHADEIFIISLNKANDIYLIATSLSFMSFSYQLGARLILFNLDKSESVSRYLNAKTSLDEIALDYAPENDGDGPQCWGDFTRKPAASRESLEVNSCSRHSRGEID